MSVNETNTDEVNVPALQARLAALNDMFIQAQSEIMDLRAAMKMRDIADRSAQTALAQITEERDRLHKQLTDPESYSESDWEPYYKPKDS